MYRQIDKDLAIFALLQVNPLQLPHESMRILRLQRKD